MLQQLAVTVLLALPFALCQSDGNPHGWDRQRRCDRFDYDPPCGVCEGIGGYAYGDRNDQIDLTTCTPVSNADDINPEDLKRPVWGTQFTLQQVYEILIGPKNDPFCFVVFPGADSKPSLCYVNQNGSKWYDADNAKAIKEYLDVQTPLGTTTSEIMHQGPNMWIVNRFPWWSLGIQQCVCVDIKENGDDTNPTPIYPIKYTWVDNLEYIGREIVGVEYLKDPAHPTELTEMELDHWAYGPHHAWTLPESGEIRRMWQPFNGLQVYPPPSTMPGEVDPSQFATIPPAKCLPGGATFRTGCGDDGFPIKDKKTTTTSGKKKNSVKPKDHMRAKTKVPRHDYKGMDFTDMSKVLNYWLNESYSTVPCDMWKVEELQQLQALFYIAKESQFDEIYQQTSDNRRLRHHLLNDIQNTWTGLNKLASTDSDPNLMKIRRDGHCHEAVMWFVHHLTEDMKQLLSNVNVKLPLLSHYRHCEDFEEDTSSQEKVCSAYREQVTCADCHSEMK